MADRPRQSCVYQVFKWRSYSPLLLTKSLSNNAPQTGRPGFDEFLELNRRVSGDPALRNWFKAVHSRKGVVLRRSQKTNGFLRNGP